VTASSLGVEDIEARLWQDPLAATMRQYAMHDHTHSQARDSHCVERLAKDISDEMKKGESVDIWLAMTHGGAFPEDAEYRLRSRYAMVAALNVGGFAPRDPDRIGFIEVADWYEREHLVEHKKQVDQPLPRRGVEPGIVR